MNKHLLLTLLLSTFFSSNLLAEQLKVASWNIAWLSSHEYNKRTDKDYQELSKYAKRLDADVIALQEVEDATWAKKVFGNDYEYFFSTKDWVQRVGFAVRKSSGFTSNVNEYQALDVGRVRYGMDLHLLKGSTQIRLLAVHLKSGCFDKPLDTASVESMPESSKRDKKEKRACLKLSNQIKPLETWVDERAKENLPFIVLGDFNRRFAIDIEKKHDESEGLWQAIDDELTEDMWSPTLTKNSKCWGGYYKDFIDHIVLNPIARANYVANSFEQLIFDGQYTRELSQSLSDHCPISIRINL